MPPKRQENIVELVANDPELQVLINELLKKKFLAPGVFNYCAYLVDTDRIAKVQKKQESRINAIAVGVGIYNDWFYELTCQALRGEDPATSAKTRSTMDKWRKQLKRNFPEDCEEIEESCQNIGQYLEYMNRKSQGL